MAIEYDQLRISKLRSYLFSIIDDIITSNNYQINADMLSNDVNNYSLDKVPTSSKVSRWINGNEIHRDLYSFRSRFNYSQDVIDNLTNIGFFEIFEALVRENNRKGVLPSITGIQSIECLNSGTMLRSDTNTAEFDIQIQITYKI